MNNKKHGIGKFILKTGITYEGRYHEGKLIEGKKVSLDGDNYEGIFDEEYMPSGDGVMIYKE